MSIILLCSLIGLENSQVSEKNENKIQGFCKKTLFKIITVLSI